MLVFPDTTLLLEYTTTGINNNPKSNEYHLSQNFPNPFRSRTSFEVILADNGNIDIDIYDITGKMVICFFR